MTPSEAIEQLKKGEAVNRREGVHPRPILKKNAWKVGTLVRALKVKRKKEVSGYKSYKARHYGPPQLITHVSFYQGYPKYTLDNVKHSAMAKMKPLTDKIASTKQKLKDASDADKDKFKAELKSLQKKIKELRRPATSKLKWHDELTLARAVDPKSEALMKARKTVTYQRKSPFLPRMLVWVHIDGNKYEGRIKKQIDTGWTVRYRKSKDGIVLKQDVDEDDIDMALKPGVHVTWNNLDAKIKKRDGDNWVIRYREKGETLVRKKTVGQNDIILR